MSSIIKRTVGELRWSQWLGILGLAALFVLLRWNNFNAPFIRDEGECDYAARLLVQGIAPYEHAFIQKPPGVVYSYALADLLLPQYFWSPRLLAYLFVALATGLLGYITKLEFGEGHALPAMWLMTPMILLPAIDQYSCNPEMFMLLPLLGTMAIYCYSRQHGHANRHWFLAGILAATTLVYKYTAFPMLALMFAAWLIDMFRAGSGMVKVSQAALCCLGGGILAALLELGFYIAHGALPSLWECTIAFNRYYVQNSDAFSWAFLWGKVVLFWRCWWMLFLVPWAILLRPNRRILFWLGIFIVAVISTSGCFYGQYYTLIMPFWALLAAAGIQALVAAISARLGRSLPWLGGLIAAITVLLVLRPDVPWMLCSSQRFAEQSDTVFIEAKIAAEKVSLMTSPNDFVYVAGSDPEILCYAHRYSPTRFISSYPLMIPNPSAQTYQETAIHDLQVHPPAVIVFVASGAGWIRHAGSPPEYFDLLNELLNQHYHLGGGYLKTDAQHGQWLDQISNDQFKNCSIVLYQLKH